VEQFAAQMSFAARGALHSPEEHRKRSERNQHNHVFHHSKNPQAGQTFQVVEKKRSSLKHN
jgi:hypothetical protein